MPRGGTPFQLYLPDNLRARLEAQAQGLGRSLHAEILHALERHLAAPPVLSTPRLCNVVVCSLAEPPSAAKPKRPRGRPRKEK